MKGSLSPAPLRAVILGRLSEEFRACDLARSWADRFPEHTASAIERFIDRLLMGVQASITRDRADEAALVLGLMPQDIWGEDWWK